jgi:hypothetical protein
MNTGNIRRLYLPVGVPRMLYSADVFLSPPLRRKKRERAVVKSIRSTPRRAALAIMGALRSSPTEVLDVYVHLLPVAKLIEKVRFDAALRLATSRHNEDTTISKLDLSNPQGSYCIFPFKSVVTHHAPLCRSRTLVEVTHHASLCRIFKPSRRPKKCPTMPKR